MNAKKFRSDLKRCKLIVFDFDGTLGEATKKSHLLMRRSFIANLAARLKLDAQHVSRLFAWQFRHIKKNHHLYGLPSSDGRLACGISDELILLSAVGRSLIGIKPADFSEQQWHALIQEAYGTSYGELKLRFKRDAQKIIPKLPRKKCWVVTNSPNEKVRGRIHAMAKGDKTRAWLANQVTGNAEKYIISDSAPLAVPEKTRLPGLDRDVHLRRGKYFDIVNRLRIERNARWDEVVVIGDIAELDLIMFAHLNAKVVLVKGRHTLAHEIEYIKSLPENQGLVVDELTEIF